MTDNHNETLSALLDNENSGKALHDLVENASQRERWFRYHLIRAILRGDAKVAQPFDISAAVAAEVARIPATKTELSWFAKLNRIFGRSGWLKPAANVAVAASVAFLTVVAVQNYQQPVDSFNPTPQNRSSMTTLETMPIGGVVNPVSFNTLHTPADASDITPDRNLLQSFMMDHQQQLQLSLQDQVLEQDSKTEIEKPPGSNPD